MQKQTLKRGKNTEVIDLKCYFCLRKCYDKGTLYNHILSQHTLEHRFSCDLCPFRTVTISLLRDHKRSTHKVKGFWTKYSSNCDLCGKYIRSRESLLWHRKNMHKIDLPYDCYFCAKKFKHLMGLQQHILLHTRERPFSCKKCPYKTVSSGRLRKHEPNHVPISIKNPIICIPCGLTFRRKKSLQNHIQIKHKKTINHFCSICGKGFYSKAGRDIHVASHGEEKAHSCPMCPKKFKTESGMRSHLLCVHLNEKSNACYFCNKTFYNPSSMYTHLRARHTGERPFLCTVCKKTFGHANSWHTHLKMHSMKKVKNLPCPFCGRLYGTRHGRTHHVRTAHTGEKIHKCAECGEHFLLREQLKRHGQKKHGHPSFECTKCGKGFALKSDVIRHSRNVHEKDNKVPARRVTCYFCLRIYSSGGINQHLRSRHTREKPFKCGICMKAYPTPKLTTNECKKHWKIILANRSKTQN